jgi:hypothetical protein
MGKMEQINFGVTIYMLIVSIIVGLFMWSFIAFIITLVSLFFLCIHLKLLR